MNDVFRMAVTYSHDYLMHNFYSISFLKIWLLYDHIKEFTTMKKFSDDIKSFGVFVSFEYFQNIWVIQILKNVDLGDHSFLVLFTH